MEPIPDIIPLRPDQKQVSGLDDITYVRRKPHSGPVSTRPQSNVSHAHSYSLFQLIMYHSKRQRNAMFAIIIQQFAFPNKTSIIISSMLVISWRVIGAISCLVHSRLGRMTRRDPFTPEMPHQGHVVPEHVPSLFACFPSFRDYHLQSHPPVHQTRFAE